VTVRVYKADQALGLAVHSGHRVVVLGYSGEPFIRIDAAGVAVNASSVTAAGVGLVRPTSARNWQLHRGHRTVIWHDARVRVLPAGTARRRWSVPLVVDGRRTQIGGEISRVPAPTPWPWLALGAPFVVVALVVMIRRRPLLRSAAVAFGVTTAAGIVATAGMSALAGTASSGSWIEGANELVFAIVGIAVIARAPGDARAIAGGALGLLGLVVGLSKVRCSCTA
jgi:hypothetical protein